MKKIIALILALALCLSLCACGGKKEVAVDPIVGCWETKSPYFESKFEFMEEDGELVGTWAYFDYTENMWGDFSFKVKEKTDHNIILLIEDGTIDEMPYTIMGNHLYLDGIIFYNTAQEVPVTESTVRLAMLINGEHYQVYDNVFMGMHADDVKAIIPETLDIAATGSASDNYQYAVGCDYRADCFIDGEYDHLELGFDENLRLVHFSKSVFHDCEAFLEKIIPNLRDEFTESKYRKSETENYMSDYYDWQYDDFTIRVEATTKKGETELSWVVIRYYYDPQN